METTIKPSNTDTAIKVIGAIFGTAHFIFQTAADLTAETEGRLVEKVSKGQITKADTIANRKASTELKQLKALDKIKAIQAKAKQKSNPQIQENHA